MVLEEFVYLKEKSERMAKSLERLNRKRKRIRGKEDFCDDGIQPDCKCRWWGKDCGDLCRYQCK